MLIDTKFELNQYLALQNQACKLCSLPFSVQDLLEEKVHKLACSHYFHSACIEERRQGVLRSHCKQCKTYVPEDDNKLMQVMPKIRYWIQETLQPHKGLKRKLENPEMIPSKRLKTEHASSLHSVLPTEVWIKIFDFFLSNKSLALCIKLQDIIKMRQISKFFKKLLTEEKIACSLSALQESSDTFLNELMNAGGNGMNALMIACNSPNKAPLVRVLLKGFSSNSVQLLTSVNKHNKTALIYAINRRAFTSMQEIFKAAQENKIDFKRLFGMPYRDFFTIYLGGPSFELMDILIDNCDEPLVFIKDLFSVLFYDRLTDWNYNFAEYLINKLQNFPEKNKLGEFCDTFANEAFEILTEQQNWCQEDNYNQLYKKKYFIKDEFLEALLQNSDNYSLEILRKFMKTAIAMRSENSVKAILKAAGPQQLELLKNNAQTDDSENYLDYAFSMKRYTIAKLLASTLFRLAEEQGDKETMRFVREKTLQYMLAHDNTIG